MNNYKIIQINEAKIGDKLFLIHRSLTSRWLEYDLDRAHKNIKEKILLTEAQLIGININSNSNYYQFGINDPNNLNACVAVLPEHIALNSKAQQFKYWRTTSQSDWCVAVLEKKNESLLPVALTLVGTTALSSLLQKKIKYEMAL